MSASPDASQARPLKRMRQPEEAPSARNGSKSRSPISVYGLNVTSESIGSNGYERDPVYVKGERAKIGASPAMATSITAIPSIAPYPSYNESESDSKNGKVTNIAQVRRDRLVTKETLESSFFLLEPHDEFTREVGDWIWNWISTRANVEVSLWFNVA